MGKGGTEGELHDIRMIFLGQLTHPIICLALLHKLLLAYPFGLNFWPT